jgi:hypothetical protein
MSDPLESPLDVGPADAPVHSPLNYRSPTTDPVAEGGSAVVANGCLGFLLWAAGVGMAIGGTRPAGDLLLRLLYVTGLRRLLGVDRTETLWAVVVVEFAAVVGLAIWLRVRWKRRGLIAGLLLGMLLTCLVPVGIVWVVCGPYGRRI